MDRSHSSSWFTHRNDVLHTDSHVHQPLPPGETGREEGQNPQKRFFSESRSVWVSFFFFFLPPLGSLFFLQSTVQILQLLLQFLTQKFLKGGKPNTTSLLKCLVYQGWVSNLNVISVPLECVQKVLKTTKSWLWMPGQNSNLICLFFDHIVPGLYQILFRRTRSAACVWTWNMKLWYLFSKWGLLRR